MNSDNLHKLVDVMVSMTGADRKDILACASVKLRNALLRRNIARETVSLPFVFENGVAVGRMVDNELVQLTEDDISECRAARVRYVLPENLS